MHDKEYRDGYVAAHTRQVLAKQMRDFRGDKSQTEFADSIDKKQTVISRLENPGYSGWTLGTLFEIAAKLNVAVFVRFVDFSTFLKYSGELSEPALHPASYDQESVDDFARLEAWQETAQDEELIQENVLGSDLYADPLSGADLLRGPNDILGYGLIAPNLGGEWHKTQVALPSFRPMQVPMLSGYLTGAPTIYGVNLGGMTTPVAHYRQSGGYLAQVDTQAIALQKELDKKEQAIKSLEAENKRVRAENAQLREALAAMPALPGYTHSYPADSENVIPLGVQNTLPPWQIRQSGYDR